MNMTRHALSVIFACLFTLMALNAWADNTPNIVIINYYPAEEMVAAVQDVLKPGDTVRAFDSSQLIVTTDPATLEKVKQLLAQIDKQPRNLIIYVNKKGEQGGSNNSQGFGGTIRQGNVALGTGKPVYQQGNGLTIMHEGLSYQTTRTTTSGTSSGNQQVRALEGSPAFITTGQDLPYRTVDRYGNPSTQYHAANQGFYVTARILGSGRVQLKISVSDDKAAQNQRDTNDRRGTNNNYGGTNESRDARTPRGTIDTTQLNTNISGRVGEWIDLGSVDEDSQTSSGELTGSGRNTSYSFKEFSVKVVPVD